jgi:lipoyl synthase
VLRVRWLGRVPYEDAHVLQRALHDRPLGSDQYLLMLEHPHAVTLGLRADRSNILADVESLGAKVLRTDRGGDVTYHGPGQLVVYPIVDVPTGSRAITCFVHKVEQFVIDALADLGLETGRLENFPGVWVEPDDESPRKICAVGIRVSRGRSMHGVALNVDPDMEWFSRIVPCGIEDKGVTSLAAEGIAVTMEQVVDAVSRRAVEAFSGESGYERQDVAGLRRNPSVVKCAAPDAGVAAGGASGASVSGASGPVALVESTESGGVREPGSTARVRLRQAGVDPDVGLSIRERKPSWLRAPVVMGDGYRSLGRTMRDLDLVTVCEEAGCPNIYECWSEGTATFMINGERCTRACGFCLVDTRHPLPIDAQEPGRVAEAVARMGLSYAVVTAVARDDLGDGGAEGFVKTVAAIRERCPGTSVELLIPDCKGDREALESIFSSRPEVLNHNLETVARLQRAVRPSAGYARSLSVLSRAARAGLTTKSGMILGMGETAAEVRGALADLRAAGVAIVTLGQYLRPSARHIPVSRWWIPEEFEELGAYARGLGFDHVESSPLTRSSYHARSALENATTGRGDDGARLRA